MRTLQKLHVNLHMWMTEGYKHHLYCSQIPDSILVYEPMLPLALSYKWLEVILSQQMKTKSSTHALSVLTVIKLTEGGSMNKISLWDGMSMLQKPLKYESPVSNQ